MDSEIKVLTLPILPIKRTVLFPGVMMPLTVGRDRSMAAVQAAMKTEEKMILVVAQRDSQTEEPGLSDLYTIGTKAIIKQIGQSSEGAIHAFVQGVDRVAIIEETQSTPYAIARVRSLDRPSETGMEVQAMHRAIQELVTELPRVIQAPGMQEASEALSHEDDPVALAYRLASLVNLSVAEDQKLLESTATLDLLRSLYVALSKEIQILQLRDKITSDAQAKIGKSQREYMLREQLKTINKSWANPTAMTTERVEEELRLLFPEVRLLRWDYQTTRQKGAHELILSHFSNRQADVLIRTQMLAKGLDLPMVTLVGIVLADVGLHLPDPFAGERVFQVVTQVAGRAGRSERGGKVVLQTFDPGNPIIQSAAGHDVDGFYRYELESRRRLGYPPFTRLVRLELRNQDQESVEKEAQKVAQKLSTIDSRPENIIGPVPCFFYRVAGLYRWQIILRGSNPGESLRARQKATAQ